MRGNPAVIYPLLYWLLQRLAELKKRSYLARYLRPVDIPEEFFADASLVEQL
jgi:intraflagellar transport protein 81